TAGIHAPARGRRKAPALRRRGQSRGRGRSARRHAAAVLKHVVPSARLGVVEIRQFVGNRVGNPLVSRSQIAPSPQVLGHVSWSLLWPFWNGLPLGLRLGLAVLLLISANSVVIVIVLS